ncbi:DUF4307 domain-containing protein [Tessaracoccus lacteus]|uniref:DUF4307 domain-containing protein n=1 Tax=Tessaracoccus lacteus TaxID=3041766 RepID=A0ABY8PW05_9ACTN|nr:DUF4307 domain-containing protein [Tessaracoccus sp. T21]WGT46652.1 DUF4307 domain-containing protein [Tessaracoccus sp. T21]
MTTDEARIQARYPKRSPTDYVLGGLASVAVLGAIAMVVVAGVEQSNPDVVGMVRSFDVPSATQVTTEIVVQRKDPSTPVVCELYAQAKSYETVGEASVDIPAGVDKLTTVIVDVKTMREATAISIDHCRVAG